MQPIKSHIGIHWSRGTGSWEVCEGFTDRNGTPEIAADVKSVEAQQWDTGGGVQILSNS
jgi:hypothetical protein